MLNGRDRKQFSNCRRAESFMTADDPKKIMEFVEQALRSRSPAMSEDAVRRTAGAVLSLLEKEIEFGDRLANLAKLIDQARADIAALKPEQVKAEFLPKATDELDAVVQTTAKATNQIMDAAEVISNVAGQLTGDLEEKLMAAVTNIYEACSFQDITGQRIAKAVTTLKVIENRIDEMVASLNGEVVEAIDDELPVGWVTGQSAQNDIDAMFASPAANDTMLHGPATPGQGGQTQADIDALFGPPPPAAKDDKLLNGPAPPGQGSSQADIDALFGKP